MSNDCEGWDGVSELGRLVYQAQNDGRIALERLLATVRPQVFAFFARKFSTDATEDLTQLALLRLSNCIMRIDFRRANAYVGTILHNISRTAYRSRRNHEDRHTGFDLVDVVEDRPSPHALAERAELIELVRRVAVAVLPVDSVDLLFGLLEGAGASELAIRYQVSPITIRTRLVKIRVVLRREFAAYQNIF